MRKRRFLFLFLISVACLFGFTNNVKADKKGSFNVKSVTSDSATIVWSGEENMNDIGVYPAKYEDGKCTDSGSRVARKSSPRKFLLLTLTSMSRLPARSIPLRISPAAA